MSIIDIYFTYIFGGKWPKYPKFDEKLQLINPEISANLKSIIYRRKTKTLNNKFELKAKDGNKNF